ncbi:peptide ABC transporter substrate-binding protein [Dictyobacter arantiisoli]|uniref:Oligopeptide-binding protein OppA n=1 Tax=Dictyobacter arantiisoli TaxID=2014874 RepID=A0A5A5TA44_9CHLR|nr:peptide ABC transporter substrate-binding protein [Dictyobacter arantiisoli]GCF07774.1 oligopeptide-binding protein OppA [Dictyobacter arantiisoli]
MKAGKKHSLQFLTSLLCLMAVFLASCGGNGTTGSTSSGTALPDAKQILHYPVIGDIGSFDPATVQDTDSNFPIQDVFTGLVTLDKNLAVVPELATALPTVSADGLTYTFTLRSGLKFSNGDPLTASDVVYSINRAVSKKLNSPVSGYLSLLKDFTAVNTGKIPTLIGDSLLTKGDSTVIIKISKPAAYFLETLSYPTSYVVNHKIVEKYSTGNSLWTDHLQEGAGSGPFKVESYSHTTGIQLVRNDNYSGPKPKLSRLSVDFYKNEDGMYKAYQAKQLDFTFVPTADVANVNSRPDYSATDVLTIRYLSLNYLAKPFDNIKIRQALALAINKDLIVKTALNNAFTASNHIIPKGMPGYDTALTNVDGSTTTTGNPTKAKELFTAGLKEEGLSVAPALTLTYYPREQTYKDAMSQVISMWQSVLGIKVNVQTVARATLTTLEDATVNNKSLPLWQAGWNADYPDPQDWLTTFFDKGSAYNQFNYGQNQSADAPAEQKVQTLLEQADTTQDQTARMKLYNQAEQLIINSVGWIPLWQEKVHSLTNPNVKNLKLNSQQLIPPDDWSNIYLVQ